MWPARSTISSMGTPSQASSRTSSHTSAMASVAPSNAPRASRRRASSAAGKRESRSCSRGVRCMGVLLDNALGLPSCVPVCRRGNRHTATGLRVHNVQMHIPRAPRIPGERSGAPLTPALRALVRSCLDEVDTLVEDYVAEVSRFEGYRGGRVPPDDLRETARFSFELLLRRVGGLPVPGRLGKGGIGRGRRRRPGGGALGGGVGGGGVDFVGLWDA